MSRARRRWQLVRRFATRDPRLVLDYGRLSLKARVGRLEPSGPRPVLAPMSPEEALEHLPSRVGGWSEGPALALVGSSRGVEDEATARETARAMASDPTLGQLAYALVRAREPEAVIETGVAGGLTSAYVLAGLADNETGRLHSIDLPPPDLFLAELVGCHVPAELRDRWDYRLGASRRLLPKTLAATKGRRRIFIHDSDHSYGNMRWELEQAGNALESGDWLLADDVNRHSAFEDAAGALGAEPLFVAQSRPGGVTGLMAKP